MNPFRTAAAAILLALFAAPTQSAGAQADAGDSIDAKCQKLLSDWKGRFAAEKFDALIAPPYVIAGNGGPERLRAYRDRTILAATRCLQKQFFDKRPTEPVLILLFESEGPYKRLAKKWLDDNEVPYYGYFRHDNVMVMNVGTGTGTLVHELTHALIKPDFPSVPGWFNEGLASLYEQCSLGRDDTIRGHENWRLPALQKAIKADKLRPLAELIGDPKFYREDLVGTNYAQARYLMFYLQQKGLLERYYEAFREGAKADPTGLDTLKGVIGPQSLEAFEKEWREWVLTLRFGTER